MDEVANWGGAHWGGFGHDGDLRWRLGFRTKGRCCGVAGRLNRVRVSWGVLLCIVEAVRAVAKQGRTRHVAAAWTVARDRCRRRGSWRQGGGVRWCAGMAWCERIRQRSEAVRAGEWRRDAKWQGTG